MSAVPRQLAGKAVTTIAFDLDYSSPVAFTSMFRKLVGARPTAYRRAAHCARLAP
jgi:AraC-like DNA-binding protein